MYLHYINICIIFIEIIIRNNVRIIIILGIILYQKYQEIIGYIITWPIIQLLEVIMSRKKSKNVIFLIAKIDSNPQLLWSIKSLIMLEKYPKSPLLFKQT